jgi:hypothetical protein
MMSLIRSEEFADYFRRDPGRGPMQISEWLQARWAAACPCGQAHHRLTVAHLRYIAEWAVERGYGWLGDGRTCFAAANDDVCREHIRG